MTLVPSLVFLLLSVPAVSLPARTLCAQTSPTRDSATLYREAQRLTSRADTIARGSASDKRAAVDLLRQAADLYSRAGAGRDVAITLGRVGVAFTDFGQQDSALFYLGQALVLARAIGDSLRESQTLSNMGVSYRRMGEPDSAFKYLRLALRIEQAQRNRTGEARTLNRIGIVFRITSQPDSALSYYRRVLPIRREVGDLPGEATTLLNMGNVLNDVGQPDSALVYLRQGLPRARAVGDRGLEVTALHNMGVTFTILSQHDSALAYLLQALPIRRAEGNRSEEANTLHNVGIAYENVGRLDSALVYYRQALTMSRALGDRLGEASTRVTIGEVFADSGRPDSALAYLQEALAVSQAAGDRAGQAATLQRVGLVYRSIGRLDSASVYFDRSTALSASISNRSGSDFNKLSYNETQTDTYAFWTLTWLALAPHGGATKSNTRTLDSASAAYGALAVSERGRAQALLDLMGDTTVNVERGADFPSEGTRLAATLRRSNSAGLIYFNTADTLITWLITSSGKVSTFRHAIARDTLAALVGQFRGSMGVENAGARLVLRGAPVEPGGERGSGKATGSAGHAWRRRAEDLATILLPREVLQQLSAEKEVVIVPQGTLAMVPFAGLPAGRLGEPFGAKLAIRYAPSLATLGKVEGRPGLPTTTSRSASLRQALVVGNPKMPELIVSNGVRDRLASLPHAETEGRGIAAQLGTQALTGAAATETEVTLRLPKATLVHLATHGFAYSTAAKARDSFVAFAPDSAHDGLLTVGEILDDPELKLTADLVVLSACQTGLGNLRQAEGTVGLQRAFLAKGARSLLVSLWNVSDAATQKLMTGFYQHWLRDPDHPSKAEALRRSQEQVRKTPGFEHPRFWAAFQLAGAR